METIYSVKRGDTLAKLSVRFGTSPSVITKDNMLAGDIYEGQRLYIRSVGKPYSVKPFDTFGKIAEKYNVDLGALVALNPIERLLPGQIILIPQL